MDPTVRCPITSVEFLPYTNDEIQNMSVLSVSDINVINNQGKPVPNGVYDPNLGPTDHDQYCPVCGQHSWNCPGHFGTIDLVQPVLHPLYVKELARLMNGICSECRNLRLPRYTLTGYINALQLVARGQIIADEDLNDLCDENRQEDIANLIQSLKVIEPNSYTVPRRNELIKKLLNEASGYRKECSNCRCMSRECKFDSFNFIFKVPIHNSELWGQQSDNSVIEVRDIIRTFAKQNPMAFKEVFNGNSPDMFFVEKVVVTPPKFRPMSVLGEKINPHPTSSSYVEILKADKKLRSLLAREERTVEVEAEISQERTRLQNSVNYMMDSALAKGSKKVPHGIRQVLEKKEGVFRKNLMGKRVNFSARSVIAPDPYVATDEVGVPEIFARTLSYPEKVTPYNEERLAQAILNGADKYPGANFVTDCNGYTYNLKNMKEKQRQSIASRIKVVDGPMPWTVGRHVVNGDYVLINRQPTLHRVSILAMKSKILPNQRTIRMHYANCSSFNADFDGDEINLHLLQNDVARSEASVLSLSSTHYITPTAGNPIRGLIQDHVDSAALITLKDKFFSQAAYQELVFAAFAGEYQERLEMLPPAIMKPCALWTGKQIISTIVMNITDGRKVTFAANAKVTGALCKSYPEETTVRFVDGYLATGIIDKAQIGASKYGMVHSMYELYGPEIASRFLTMLTRLFTFYMQGHGFSCGIADMGISDKGEELRQNMVRATDRVAQEVAAKFVNEFATTDTHGNTLQEKLWDLIKNNDMKSRYDSLAMGSLNKASSNAINGIFPNELTKPFPANHMIMMTTSGAKGSNVNSTQISVHLGQQSLEGKRVPLMRSGKALPSFGFMDLSPRAGGFVSSRFLTGLTPEEYFFHAMGGREGLTDTAVKTANTGYLQRCIIKNIEGVVAAYDGTVRDADDTIIQFLYGEDGIDPLNVKYLTKFDFISENPETYEQKLRILPIDELDLSGLELPTDSYIEPETVIDIARSLILEQDKIPERVVNSLTQNWLAKLHDYFGLITARQQEYIDEPPYSNLFRVRLARIAMHNFFRCIINPGEVVGVIAAEAIGEPATQMTLNTFHLAGYGGTNVTLGIPRLREILIVATRTPATPTMQITMESDNAEDAKEFVAEFKRVSLKEVVLEYTVKEHIPADLVVRQTRTIEIELKLDGTALEALGANPEWVVANIRSRFASLVKKKLAAVFKSTGAQISSVDQKKKNKERESEEMGADKEEEMGADLAKKKGRRSEQNSYEADAQEDSEEPPRADSTKADEEDESKEEAEEEGLAGEESRFDADSLALIFTFRVSNVSIKILFESIVNSALEEVMVHEVPGVRRASVADPRKDSGQQVVVTEGVNYEEVLNRVGIDMRRFYTNDIGLILKRFGIEAARAAIIKEVDAVFQSYCIDVDKRHLMLIADFVTNSGDWLGLSRHTMKKCASPMQQMSFETTTAFLTHAAMHGASDMMASPSASLTTGNLIRAGSGLCEIMLPFE